MNRIRRYLPTFTTLFEKWQFTFQFRKRLSFFVCYLFIFIFFVFSRLVYCFQRPDIQFCIHVNWMLAQRWILSAFSLDVFWFIRLLFSFVFYSSWLLLFQLLLLILLFSSQVLNKNVSPSCQCSFRMFWYFWTHFFSRFFLLGFLYRNTKNYSNKVISYIVHFE